VGVRKNAKDLAADEKQRFVQAVLAVKANGTYDQLVQTHFGQMPDGMGGMPGPMQAHRSPHFLPWHRRFLLDLEGALQQVDASVSIPYWDWTDSASTNAVFAPDLMGGAGTPVATGPFAGESRWRLNVRSQFETWRSLRRDLGGAALPSPTQVRALFNQTAYDQSPWNRNAAGGFRRGLEGLHDNVHGWVGGSMNLGTSPNDPVFFLHHSNVDRLWASWQALRPQGQWYLPISGGPAGYNLNEAMEPWTTTPADMLDYRGRGYEYAELWTPDRGSQVTDLTVGAASVAASINLPGEVDRYRFTVTSARTHVVETEGTTDVIATLFGPNNETTQIAENDDASSTNRNARIEWSLSPGTYFLHVRGYQATTGPYRVSVRAQAGPQTPPTIQVNGAAVSGTIQSAGAQSRYRFVADVAGPYRIETGGSLDSILRLFGPDGQAAPIAVNDDAGPGLLTSRIDMELTPGTYVVEVSGYRTRTGPYTLTVLR
jgi:tyrosinase